MIGVKSVFLKQLMDHHCHIRKYIFILYITEEKKSKAEERERKAAERQKKNEEKKAEQEANRKLALEKKLERE